MTWWPLICWILGAALWAVPSVLLFRFGSSRFRFLKREYWNPVYSSKAAKQTFGYKHDAFHHFQSAAIIVLALPTAKALGLHLTGINFLLPVMNGVQLLGWITFDLDFLIAWLIVGTAWNVCFPATYGFLSPYHRYVKK
jgi:hypothetical protein